jgi:fused signal recognition particle receptor
VLAIARRLALPIRYIAIGESIEDFAEFRAAEFTDALLGDAPP